ncbi:CPBP family intramembrane glutamic endopeptidase [Aliikangiella sp. G2MR2-5]|uniref:CPBP family intramembrane glutamic endopeptidase n=1 Tax=Aliikangiella sp. G2MR2-5 TaxID=2788943 RepID=UPI0018AA7A3A|nr:CPBP family intramembrane glutamic endopeptidase [Aliikangiella sp. G2MR2-5]
MTTPVNTQINKKALFLDLFLILATLFAIKYFLLQFSSTWTFAGPVSLIVALTIASWRLKSRSQLWSELGFAHTQSHIKLLLWTVGALVVTIVTGVIAGAIANGLLSPQVVNEQTINFTQNRFADVPGNLPVYLYWLLVSWIIGGFTEELLFRGYLLNRFESIFTGLPAKTTLAIIAQAVIFGQQHMYYQGITGMVETGLIGIVSGTIYILCGRRLWPLIISHGLANTLGMTMIYLGNVPAA